MNELPWFKFYTEALHDPKFDVVANDNKMQHWEVLGIWTAMLCIAANSPIRGTLAISELRGLGIKDLKSIIRWDDHYWDNTEFQDFYSFERILESFIELDMITQDECGTFKIKNFEERQETKEEKAKRLHNEAQKRYKENHTINNDSENDSEVTQDSLSTSISISSSLSDSLIFNDIKSHFEQLTGLPVLPQAIKAIDEIIAFGGTPADITEGYKWFKDNSGKPLKYYGQLVGPTRTAMSKRLNGNGYKHAKPKFIDRVSAEARSQYGER